MKNKSSKTSEALSYIIKMSRTWWRHQMETFSALLALTVQGIHRSPANSPHKGQWRGAFRFLRRHRAHYDVTVIDIMGNVAYHLSYNQWALWAHAGRHCEPQVSIPRECSQMILGFRCQSTAGKHASLGNIGVEGGGNPPKERTEMTHRWF